MATTMTTLLKKSLVRSRASFLSSITARLDYGTEVQVLNKNGNWFRIASPSGWLHFSALTEEKLELSKTASQASVGAEQDEITLAGKGFNRQVENNYRKENPKLNFALIDKMEAQKVSVNELKKFLQEGKLNTTGSAS